MPYSSKIFSQLAATTLLAAIFLSCQEQVTWESHWEKGDVYFQQRDFVKAETELKAALKLAETGQPEYPKLTQSLIGLGKLYDAQRQYDEAQQQFERALHLIESSSGAGHSDLIMPLNYLGALHGIQHHFDLALPYFERALSIREQSLGTTQSLMGEHIKYLAAFHTSRAQYQEAEAFLSRVLELPKLTAEQIDKNTAEYLDNYTRLHTAQEEYNKAKPYLDEFDPINGGQLPKNLHDSSASLTRLTNLLATQDKFGKAEGLLRRVVQTAEKGGRQTGIGAAKALSNLADLYWAWGKLDLAIPLFERSLSMAKHPTRTTASKSLPSLSTTLTSKADTQIAEVAAQHSYVVTLRKANQAVLQDAPAK